MARRGRLELRPVKKATLLPFKKQKLPVHAHTHAPRATPTPLRLLPQSSVWGPPSHLPDARPKSWPREKEAELAPTPAGRRLLLAARLLQPSALTQHALPGPELSRSRSPWGQSGLKKQEVWDGLSPGARSPKWQAFYSVAACLPYPTPPPLPALSLWRASLGSVSGAGLNSKNPDVLGGHSRHNPRVLLAVASLGFTDPGMYWRRECSGPDKVVVPRVGKGKGNRFG